MCGAAIPGSVYLEDNEGLSPRVWGSRRKWYPAISSLGSIPTCVGQPEWPGSTRIVVRVYPHVCGAAQGRSHASGLGTGLSPRVWGSPSIGSFHRYMAGSIPTCVGQPLCTQAIISCSKVYPHVCGAACWVLARVRRSLGLSPRVWGSRVRET